MHYLGIIIASIFGYLIGSISFSIIIVKWKKGIDIRSVGSKNAGATNTTRELGKWWGFAIVWLDGLKVVWALFIAVLFSLIPSSLFSETSYIIPAIFVLIGHCYPIWYKFKGGKAVATFLGLLFVANIWYLLIFLLIWFIVVGITKKVSIASIVAAVIVGVILIWLPWINGLTSWNSLGQWNSWDLYTKVWEDSWTRFTWANYLHLATENVSGHQFADSMLTTNIIIIIGTAILAFRHFPNIKRILNKKEPITFPKMTEQEKEEYRKYISHRHKTKTKKTKSKK